jgi:DNA-binding PadR family transcriptional regulator
MSFVAEKTGKDIEKLMSEDIDTALQAMIPAECPFGSMDDWLHQLKDWGCVPISEQKRETPFHPREYYELTLRTECAKIL